MGDFSGTGIEIWAGFGPVGNTDFEGIFFIFFLRKLKKKKSKIL